MSKKLKLSPWHDGSVKPVHVGVYQSHWDDWYRYFDGCRWFNGASTAKDAFADRKILRVSEFQDWPWRGVLK